MPELKTGNWSDAEVATVLAGYDPDKSAASVETLMGELGRSKRSVTGKLVSEGVYSAPDKPEAKPRDEGPTKAELMALIKGTGFDVTGFDGATKDALARILTLVTKTD